MTGSTYVGRRASAVATSMKFEPVTKVIYYVSDGIAFTAGKDGGQVIEADNPYATQEMVDEVLRKMQGRPYIPIEGTDALINPAAEIGDGLHMAGQYTVLASADLQGDALTTADVSAPGKREPESELGTYKGAVTKQISHSAAALRSSITKTAEQIRLEVTNEIEGVNSSIELTAAQIRSEVNDVKNNLSSSIEQTASEIRAEITGPEGSLTILANTIDGLTVTDRYGTVRIKGGSIEAGSITSSQIASSAITADKIASSAITSDKISANSITVGKLSTTVQNNISSAQTTASDAANAASSAQSTADSAYTLASSASTTASSVNTRVAGWTYSGTTNINGSKIQAGTVTAGTLQGGVVDLLNEYGSKQGEITIRTAASTGYCVGMTGINAGLRFVAQKGYIYLQNGYQMYLQMDDVGLRCRGHVHPDNNGGWDLGRSNLKFRSIYLTNQPWASSDERLKEDIRMMDARYITMLDSIDPVSFRLKGEGKTHCGFVAQDVKAAMDYAGLTESEFDGWGTGADGYQMLRYTEFVPILLAKIRQLECRLEAIA